MKILFCIKRIRNQFTGAIVFLMFLVPALDATASDAAASVKNPASQRATTEGISQTKYEISVEIDPATRSYRGRQKISFSNKQNRSTNYLLFFVYPNDPALTRDEQKHMKVSGLRVNGKPAKIEEKGSFLRILLEKDWRPGQAMVVEMEFEASIPLQKAEADLLNQTMEQMLQMFSARTQAEVDYGIFSAGKEIINLGYWYPVLSKFDRDGWDEEKYTGIGDVSYFDPAEFEVRMVLPASHQAITSGTITKRLPLKEGKIEQVASAVLSRDFAIELSPRFEEQTRLQNRTAIRSYFLPEHRESGKRALEAGVKALQYYEEIFGPYPYTELDIVEAPLFGGAGGVEFPGLVTISSILYRDPEGQGAGDLKDLIVSSPAFDELLEFVVAHEVAHQWWNAVVGSNSKKHPFIDESMANYSAILYFEHYYGRDAAERQMALQLKVNYQIHRMLGGSDKPVLQPASSFQGALEYSAIVYGKGALYFDRLRQLLGDRNFYGVLKEYYRTFWFRIAGPEDLTRIAKRNYPAEKDKIEALYHRWILGQHGDEDIGPGTLEAILKNILPPDQTVGVDQLQKVFEELETILKQQ